MLCYNPTNGWKIKTSAQSKYISRLQLKMVAKATTGHMTKTTVQVAVETTIRIHFHQNKELQNEEQILLIFNRNIQQEDN